MASPSPAPQPGLPRPRKARRRERYELQEKVGMGGIGTVYKALDRELNRTVAVKILHPELLPDLANLLRLKRELVLAARVHDEHVVRVHDIGEVNGRALISMDWVDGETLAQVLSRVHRLPPSQVLGFATQIAQALRAIHAASIVHLDLKPGNLLIRRDGTVLVTDFGMARSALPQDPDFARPGEILRTPRYLAPEQLAGLPADARSDFYALGLVLLEVLTGTTALETLAPLRLRLLATHTDRSRRTEELRSLAILEGVIRRCLHLDRTERYANADSILADLKIPVVASAAAVSRTRLSTGARRFWVVVLAVGLFVILLLGYRMWRQRVADAAQVERAYYEGMRLSTSHNTETDLRNALDLFDRVVSNRPEHEPAVRARIDTLIRLFERTQQKAWIDKARQAFETSSAARLSQPERIIFRARIDLDAGAFPDVIRALQNASALRSYSADANRLLGRAFAASQRMDEAVQCYRAALELEPESWAAHNDLAYAQLRLGYRKEALKEFARVAELQHDSPIGFAGQGAALLELGDLARSRVMFEAALERMPSPETYYNLGMSLFLSRQYGMAIPFFESASAVRPDSDRYIIALGDALRRLKRHEESRNAYVRALGLSEALSHSRPLSVQEQARRAVCFARLGDFAAAKSLLDSVPADSTDPESDVARAILALLQDHTVSSGRHLAAAVRHGYPPALAQIHPDFDDIP